MWSQLSPSTLLWVPRLRFKSPGYSASIFAWSAQPILVYKYVIKYPRVLLRIHQNHGILASCLNSPTVPASFFVFHDLEILKKLNRFEEFICEMSLVPGFICFVFIRFH